MPLIATKGAASVQGFGEFAQSAAPVYIEDVMSVYLYTGTGANQTFNNGVDLSTKGGMVWIKQRSSPAEDWRCVDSARGITNGLQQNLTNAQQNWTGLGYVTSFNTNGFSIGTNVSINTSAYNYASWTFRKQPKFFDVVTYTGTGSGPSSVSHLLGSVPGCVIIKSTSRTGNWVTLTRMSTGNYAAFTTSTNGLQSTGAANSTTFNPVGAGALTATTFDPSWWNSNATPGAVENICDNGVTYVAYLFAHNAGGFGLTGTDNVISCGSFTTDGSGNATVSLGYEPQWLLVKESIAVSGPSWYLIDNMRGFTASNSVATLSANSSGAEVANNGYVPTATGFQSIANNANGTGIYIAIRRGPMKTPTSGTSVFSPNAVANDSSAITTNFPVDGYWEAVRTGNPNNFVQQSRLTGGGQYLTTSSTAAENNTGFTTVFQNNTGYTPGTFGSSSLISYAYRRAPGFFDVVCYTGTGSATTQTHNLGVVPEWIITKSRSQAGEQWWVYSSTVGIGKYILLSSNGASGSDTRYINATPTATTYAINSGDFAVNASSVTYVAYLFATVAGVSKVGSYTGTGALQTINCGFTSGARWVLIKRTDSTGDWYVYDSARGITSGNDPYLFLNSTAAEVTGTNYVDTDTTGFKVTAAAPAGLNASGGTYIFLAIA